MTRPTILLNPGPVTLTERVRRALMREDLCHREPEFAELTLEIKQRLARVYAGSEEGFEAVTLTGSGTCAVEAMLASLVPANGKVLVVANGVYGERMAAMVEAHGKELIQVRSEWLEPMDLEQTARLLASDAAITHVAAVHNETTTGRLNDVAALGRLCRQHERPLLLDAVSSFAGEAVEFANWNVEAVAATANKCLHGVPGMAFVLVDQSRLAHGASAAPSLYLDLFRYAKEQAQGFSPFTQAVHACFALREALCELEEQGGWQARNRRYRELSQRIGDGFAALGVKTLLPASESSSMIRSFHLPQGFSYLELHDALKERGFVIYAGQGDLQQSIFRIANMGDIRDEDVQRLLAGFGELLAG